MNLFEKNMDVLSKKHSKIAKKINEINIDEINEGFGFNSARMDKMSFQFIAEITGGD